VRTVTRAERLEAALPGLLRRMFNEAEDGELSELPLAQLRILRTLLDFPRAASEVGDMLGYSPSGLSQITHRLIKAGLVVKTKDTHDARVKHLALSPKGRSLMESRRTARVEQAGLVLSRLTEDEQVEFLRLLDKMTIASQPESWTTPIERITA
jgi:DNA-binding MarR family transcriptional regulator